MTTDRLDAAESAERAQRERARIAAILHDELQQTLAAAHLHLSLPDGAAEAQVLLKQAIAETRALSHELAGPPPRRAPAHAAARLGEPLRGAVPRPGGHGGAGRHRRGSDDGRGGLSRRTRAPLQCRATRRRRWPPPLERDRRRLGGGVGERRRSGRTHRLRERRRSGPARGQATPRGARGLRRLRLSVERDNREPLLSYPSARASHAATSLSGVSPCTTSIGSPSTLRAKRRSVASSASARTRAFGHARRRP